MRTGWKETLLGEVLTERREIPTPESLENGEVSIVSKIGFDQGKIDLRSDGKTKTGMILIRPGDLVVSGINATKGAIAIYDENQTKPIAATIHYSSYIPNKDRVDIKYLWWFLRSAAFREIVQHHIPGGIKTELKSKRLLSVPIPLPSLDEQCHIVERVIAVTTKITVAKNLRNDVQVNLKRLEFSILKAVFEGKLLKQEITDESALDILEKLGKSPLEDEELQPLPKGWCWTTTGDLCDCIVPNRDKPKSFTGHIPWITLPDFSESIEIGKSKVGLGLSKEEVKEYRARVIPKGSVLMSCIGRFGITAVTNNEVVVNQQLHAFLITEGIINARYLAYAIRIQKPYMDKLATATTISYLNKENCNSVPIPLAPLGEQERIVKYIDRIVQQLSVIERLQASTQKELKAMQSSILNKAFKSEL